MGTATKEWYTFTHILWFYTVTKVMITQYYIHAYVHTFGFFKLTMGTITKVHTLSSRFHSNHVNELAVSLGFNGNYVSGCVLPPFVVVHTNKSRALPLWISRFPRIIRKCVPTLSGSMGTSRLHNRQGIRVFCSIREVLVTTVKLNTTHEFRSK